MTADARWIHQVDQLEAHVNELLTDLGAWLAGTDQLPEVTP